MLLPRLTRYHDDNASAILASQRNTFVQGAGAFFADLRGFVAEPGMQVMVSGRATFNDGGQGLFQYFTGPATDDNFNTLVVSLPNWPQASWKRVNINASSNWPPPVQLLPIGQGSGATATASVTGSTFTGFTLTAGGTGYPLGVYSTTGRVYVTYTEGITGVAGSGATGVAYAPCTVAAGVITAIGAVTRLGVFSGSGNVSIGFANAAPNTTGLANYPLPGFYQFDSTVDLGKFLYLNVTPVAPLIGIYAPDDTTSAFPVGSQITLSLRGITTSGFPSVANDLQVFGGAASTLSLQCAAAPDGQGLAHSLQPHGFGNAGPAFSNYYGCGDYVFSAYIQITKTTANFWQGIGSASSSAED